MGTIVQMQSKKTGENQYPRTYTKAVIDENATPLDTIIQMQDDNIGVSGYPQYSESETCTAGQVRKHGGYLYTCLETTTGAWDPTKWKQTNFKTEMDAKLNELGSKVVAITAKDLAATIEVTGDGQSVKFIALGKVEKERPIKITSSQPITGTVYLYENSDYSGSYEVLGRFEDSSEFKLIVNEEGYIRITSIIGLNVSVVFSLFTSFKYAKEEKLEKHINTTQQQVNFLIDNINYRSKAVVVENSSIYTYYFNYKINGEKVKLVSAKAISGTMYLAEEEMVNSGEKIASLVEDSIIEIEEKVGYIFVTSKQESDLYLFPENTDIDNDSIKKIVSKRYLVGTGLDNVLESKFETTPTCIGGIYKLNSTIPISGTVYLYEDSSYNGSYKKVGKFDNSTECVFKAESQGFVKITTRLAEGINVELSMYANSSLLCLGDSLTFGSGTSESGGVRLKGFPFLLANKTGFTAINGGYPSDTAKNVAARCNVIPYYFSSDFTLPKDGSIVQIGTYGNHNIYSSDDRKMINLGYFSGGIGKNAGCSNPCYITVNGEIIPIEIVVQSSTNMAANTDKVVVRRLNASEKDLLIKKGTIIYTIMSFYKDADCLTLWIGTNGSLLGEDLLNYCKMIVGFFNTNKVIIIGSHYPYSDDLSSIEKTEQLLQREFGAQYFNLRDYMVNYGLDDANLTPSQTDEEYIQLGKCPPQLLTDGVHFTEAGYEVIAFQLYLKGKLLGYWDY